MSGWSKAGFLPFNPDRVLKDIQKPEMTVHPLPDNTKKLYASSESQLETPKTSESLMSLCNRIERSIVQGNEIDRSCRSDIRKLANAAENAFADRAILLDENLLLFEQNNEKTTRKSLKAKVVGSARVMSYEDIVEAQKQRDAKDAAVETARARRSKRKPTTQVLGKRSRAQELEEAESEIVASGMEAYCTVIRF